MLKYFRHVQVSNALPGYYIGIYVEFADFSHSDEYNKHPDFTLSKLAEILSAYPEATYIILQEEIWN